MNELIENLIVLLENKFGDVFKSYNYGTITSPGNSSLPMICVAPGNTVVNNSGTLKDQNIFSVKVTVIVSVKKYINNVSGESNTLDSLQALVKLMEERNSDGAVLDSTVIGIIRQNITASGSVLYNNELSAEYEEYLDVNEFPQAKVTLTFSAESRSNRN